MTISLLGDGIFLIAMAWQAYELWNAPAALSILGIGMTIPTIAFLLPAGVLSDRFDRRTLVLWSDVGRAVVVGAPRRARADRGAHVLAPRRPRRPVRHRRGVLHPCLRGARPGHRPAATSSPPRTRSTSSSVRSRSGSSGRRSAAFSSRPRAPASRSRSTPATFLRLGGRGGRSCGRPPTSARSTSTPRSAAVARASDSCEAASGCGGRSDPPRSPISRSWALPRSCCPTS